MQFNKTGMTCELKKLAYYTDIIFPCCYFKTAHEAAILLVKWTCFFPESIFSFSVKCYTCETEPAVCQLPNHALSRIEVAKQMAATNVIQLPVETKVQKVKSIKK